MKLSKFKYKLPAELIAQHPSPNRDECRLLVLNRKNGEIEHKIFKDVIDYFDEHDVFVFNDTKVFPARLYGNKEKTGAEIEVFLLRELNQELRIWDVLVDPARKIRIGNKLYFGEDDSLVAEVIDNTTSRGRTLRFLYDGDYDEFKKLLFSLLELIMRGKIKRAKQAERAGESQPALRTTKDYVEQVIQAARFTAPDEDTEEFQFLTLEEFIQHWQEKGIEDSILENLKTFCRLLPRVFDGGLTLEFNEARVLFRANQLNETGKVVRSKVITTVEVEPKGLVVRAGRSYKLGVLKQGVRRSLSFARRVERVEDFAESDINPIKERYKEFMGTSRVPARWIKVLEDMRSESATSENAREAVDAEQPADSAKAAQMKVSPPANLPN